MARGDVIDLSAAKKVAPPPKPVAEEAKPAAKKRVVKSSTVPVVIKVEEPKPKPEPVKIEQPVVEEAKPVAAKKSGRFVAGSPEAKVWGEKMRQAKLAKKKAQGEEVLIETVA